MNLPILAIRTHGRLIAFGMLMVFCSGPGQTYFISLFGDEIRQAFGLSHGDFGSLFSVGTIAGAAVLLWAGRLIDRVPLFVMAGLVVAIMAALCALMGLLWSAAALGFAFFGLRLVGQGLTVHTAMTTMARSFAAARGKAISLASLGHTIGNAALPALVVAALAVMTWREVWFVAAAVLLATVPVVLWLLRGHAARTAVREAQVAAAPPVNTAAYDARLGEALRDPGLWMRLPALMAPAFVFTGLIFHQDHIAAVRGWPDTLMAAGFTTFAIVSAVSLLAAGPMVDRFSARRLVPVFLLPLTLASLCLAFGEAQLFVPVFFGLLGAGTGLAVVLNAAIWAELYGTRHLGAIRAFGQSGMGFASGLAPSLFGVLMDAGVSVTAIAVGSAVYCVAASLLAAFAQAPRMMAQPVLR